MVIKGMVFVLVTLNHLSNSMKTTATVAGVVPDTSLNGGGGKEQQRKGSEDEFFTEESFTPLNQLRMNEEQVCVSLFFFYFLVFPSFLPSLLHPSVSSSCSTPEDIRME